MVPDDVNAHPRREGNAAQRRELGLYTHKCGGFYTQMPLAAKSSANGRELRWSLRTRSQL